MIFKLKGILQHYVWGGADYLPQFLHIEKQNDYYAELWLGAHSSAPSMLETTESAVKLDVFLQQNPTALGEQSRQRFGNELPYLLKILDVKQPLSIQLHPTKQQAEIGFAAENAKGIALNDPQRTYKDNNHKPEMMIALSNFWLLHGFKVKRKILDTLNARPSLQMLAAKLRQQDLPAFYADIMRASQVELSQWILPILRENQGRDLPLDNPDYWVCYTMKTMAISEEKLDAGLICFYLFNIVHLKPGEGIFQEAGIPHAYLRGQNIELMAASDNVIRGGLTPKYVNITELLKVVNYREIEPQIIAPAPQKHAHTYMTPAEDFALENIPLAVNASHQSASENAQVLLVMEGEMILSSETQTLLLQKGQSALITAGSQYQLTAKQSGYAVMAKLP